MAERLARQVASASKRGICSKMATSNLADLRADPATQPLATGSERDCGSAKPGPHLDLPPEQQAIRDRCFHPSGNFVEFPIDEVEGSIADRFEKIVRMYADRPALKMGDQTLSYAELNAAANRIARAVLSTTSPDTRCVALLFEQGMALMAAMIGVLKAGKFFITLDPAAPHSRSASILQNAGAGIVVTDQRHRWLATEIGAAEPLIIDDVECAFSTDNLSLPIAPEATAFVAFTSGSTGQPKGVVWTHRMLLHHEMLSINISHICDADRVTLLSFNTASTLTNIFLALLSGAALYPFDVLSGNAARMARWLHNEQITVCLMSATLFRSFCDNLPSCEVFPDVRLLKAQSEGAHGGDIDRFHRHFAAHCILLHGLSSSESGFVTAIQYDQKTEIPAAVVPIGYPVAGKEVLLLDESGHELSCHQVGEIVVRSRYLAEGYWQMPELSRAKFKVDPDRPGLRRYFTGDLGLRRADGCLVHKGRKDDRVKIRGYGVETAAVENALREHPSVKQGFVLPCKDRADEQQLVGYFVSHSERPVTTGDLREFLRAKLPEFMIPAALVRMDAMPMTASGKIDRSALPNLEQARRQLLAASVEPRTELERSLARLWARVLTLETVGVHDNFFDLGGHSLSAIRLAGEVERFFGQPVAVATLLKAPTIAELAKEIVKSGQSASSPLISVQPQGSRPPFFCVHGADCYARLAQHLGIDQPFFGLAQHLERRKVRHTRIEDIAAYYIEASKTVQAQGPYYIGGHSIGGLIALEMAQQLQKSNQEVALLVVLDSGAPVKIQNGAPFYPATPSGNCSENLAVAGFNRKWWSMRQRLRERLGRGAKAVAYEMYHRLGRPVPPVLQSFYVDQVVYGQIYPDAHRRYQPQPYSGRAVYFKSEDTRERVAGWQKLMTHGLEVRAVAGNHLTMLAEPHLKGLANTLRQCLSEAVQ
jgi:amino acid adenylation domain-containing protein